MKKTTTDIWLTNGNITIFCGSHTDSFKKDILASSLLSELVATQKSRNREASWLTYTTTVQKICWVINSRATQQLKFENSNILNIVERSTGNALPQDERQALTNAFAQLARLQPDSPAAMAITEKLQSNATVSDTDTVAPVSTAALLTIIRYDKTVVTLQMAFETAQGIEIDILDQPVLSFTDERKTNIWLMSSVLDERLFNQVRDDVLKKVGLNIETNLLHITAPNGLN
jgi:deoxyxylulose-5-phosphate synthase